MDSGGTPQGIRHGHLCDEGLDLRVDWRAAHGGPAGEPCPVLAEAPPPPPQHGVWRDDRGAVPPPSPHPGEPDPEEPIASVELGPTRRSLVYGELLAQGEVLERELAVAAAEEREEAKQ